MLREIFSGDIWRLREEAAGRLRARLGEEERPQREAERGGRRAREDEGEGEGVREGDRAGSWGAL